MSFGNKSMITIKDCLEEIDRLNVENKSLRVEMEKKMELFRSLAKGSELFVKNTLGYCDAIKAVFAEIL